MGDTSETNTKVLSRELFFRCGSTKTPIQKNHYLRDKVPFPKSGHQYPLCSMFREKVLMLIPLSNLQLSYLEELVGLSLKLVMINSHLNWRIDLSE